MAMLCIVTLGLQSKCITTPSLNMAITGRFLCCTSLLDSGLYSRGVQASLGHTELILVFIFFFFLLLCFYPVKSGSMERIIRAREMFTFAHLHFSRSTGLER